MAIMPHARAKTEPPATRHPPHVTRHPLPLTRHPLPVTRHPPPVTRHPSPATRHPRKSPAGLGRVFEPPPAPERDPVDESVSGVSSERSLSIRQQTSGSMVDKCLVSFAGLSSTCD